MTQEMDAETKLAVQNIENLHGALLSKIDDRLALSNVLQGLIFLALLFLQFAVWMSA